MTEKLKGGYGHKGLKPESVFFWHNMQNWPFFFFFFKDMWKTAPNRFEFKTGASSAICFQFHLPLCLLSADPLLSLQS